MLREKDLFKKYSQEIRDIEFRLEALSYNKGFVFIAIIYTPEAIERVEVDKRTFKKLVKILNKGESLKWMH